MHLEEVWETWRVFQVSLGKQLHLIVPPLLLVNAHMYCRILEHDSLNINRALPSSTLDLRLNLAYAMCISNVNVVYAMCVGWFYVCPQLSCEIKHESLFQLTRNDAKNLFLWTRRTLLCLYQVSQCVFFFSRATFVFPHNTLVFPGNSFGFPQNTVCVTSCYLILLSYLGKSIVRVCSTFAREYKNIKK